jgi:hypothetical protein
VYLLLVQAWLYLLPLQWLSQQYQV